MKMYPFKLAAEILKTCPDEVKDLISVTIGIYNEAKELEDELRVVKHDLKVSEITVNLLQEIDLDQ